MLDASFNAFALNNCDYLQINKNVQLALTKLILVHNDQASFEKLIIYSRKFLILFRLPEHHWEFLLFCVCYPGFFIQSSIIINSIAISIMYWKPILKTVDASLNTLPFNH